jgi:hypothetical protein
MSSIPLPPIVDTLAPYVKTVRKVIARFSIAGYHPVSGGL